MESINVSGSYIGLSENEEHTSKIVSVSIPANTYSSNTIVNYSVTVHMNGNTTTTTTTTTISTSTTPPPQNRYNIFAGEVPIKRIEIITTDFNQVYENRLIRRVFIGD